MIGYECEPYSARHDEHFMHLLRLEGFERNPAGIRWIFSPPVQPGRVVVARDESSGDVVGLLGMVPVRLSIAGRTVLSFTFVDVIIHKASRGKGLFGGLARTAHAAAQTEGAALVWGFPNEAAAKGWFTRYGWTSLGSPPLLMRPLRTGFFARRLAPWLRWFDVPVPIRPARLPSGFEEISRIGNEGNVLWDRFSARLNCAAVRDSSCLNWRLFEHPDHRYRTVVCRSDSGEICALVATKMVEREGAKFLYVMDAISPSPADDRKLRLLLRHEIARAASEGADAALSWAAPTAPNRGVYRKLGFLPLPDRLRPSRSHVGFRTLAQVDPRVTEPDAWYVSFLDLDTV